MSEPRTPQVPMVDQNGQPFYPLTQYNQIVMPGGGRWDGETSSPVELDATLKEAGKAADAGAVGMALNELNQAIPAPYSLPTASATVKGGVMVGNGLAIDENGVLSLALPDLDEVSY